MKKKTKERIATQLRLPIHLHEKIKAKASQMDFSQNQLIVYLLASSFEKEKKEKL